MSAEIHVHYERPLTSVELADVMKHAPDQVHLAPGQHGVMAYWFEMIAWVGQNSLRIGAFYVRADTPEAAKQHAMIIGEEFRSQVEQDLRESEREKGGNP